MSASRERRASGAGLGWFSTLGGALLLLGFGFGVGLVAGSALEEPELVASHLSGEATEVPLPKAAPAAPAAPTPAPRAPAVAPEAAAPPAKPSAAAAEGGDGAADFSAGEDEPPAAPVLPAAPRATARPSEPAPPPAPPRAPAPALAARPTGFAIQVGAFTERRAAEQLVGSLQRERFRAYVVEGARGEAAPYRVRVGPYPTREKASDEAARLHARRRLPTWVIAEGGP